MSEEAKPEPKVLDFTYKGPSQELLAWEAKRKIQMEDEAKLLKVILEGTETELDEAIKYWKTNFTSELGPPINIRRAELRLMDLRGEPRPDVLHLLHGLEEKLGSRLVEMEKSSGKAAQHAINAAKATAAKTQ